MPTYFLRHDKKELFLKEKLVLKGGISSSPMTIYNLYFFNNLGTCVAYKEWSRERRSAMPQEEEFKLVYGMLLSLRSFR